MPRKKPPPPASRPPSVTGIAFKAGLTVAVAIGLLSLLVWLGNRAGSAVANLPRYDVPVDGLVVTPPAGVDRSTFLKEVRAAGGLPETVSAVSEETPPLLAKAFARHPWVRDVVRVSVKSDRSIHVELSYREPALAIPMIGTPNIRLVDPTGILLPPAPVPPGLPELKIDHPQPAAAAGQIVPDELVKRAAELVTIYRSSKPRSIEKTKTGWRILPATGSPLLVSW
jgi:hypothetical protein